MILALALACAPDDAPRPIALDPPAPTSSPEPAPTEPPPVDPPTWHRDVRPLVEVHCTACHDLDATGAAAGASRVIAGEMPPAQFDPACRDVVAQRWLDADGVATFAAWQAAGYPDGDPADYVAPGPSTPDAHPLVDPDLVVAMDAPYLPDPSVDDDTVAFEPTFVFPEETYVTAARVVPGAPEMVHHVTVFLVDELGQPLLGTPLADSPSNALVAWAPGTPPWVLPEGAAIVVPAGARVRIEVHYSVVSMPSGPVEDLTTVELWTRPDPPDDYAFLYPFNLSPILLPPGEVTEISAEAPSGALEGRLVAILPHMHLLGRAVTMSLLRDGAELCLLDSPNYDFGFQELFWYTPEARLDVSPADGFRVTCTFENTTPHDVTDGPDTADEMCQVGWLMTRPYGDPEP